MEQNTPLAIDVTTDPPAPFLDPLGQIGNFRIFGYPALCSYGNGSDPLLYMAWRGSGDDNENAKIYIATFDGVTWSAATHPPFHSDASPALCVYRVKGEDRLYLAWRGSSKYDQNNRIYFAWFDGTSWSDPVMLTDFTIKNSPALCTYQMPNGARMYMAWHNPESDRINYAWFDGSADDSNGWSSPFDPDPKNSAFTIGSSPALCVADLADDDAGPTLYMAWRGAGSGSSRIYFTTLNGLTWKQPEIASRATVFTISGTPALCAYQGRLYMMWRGADPDDTIYWSRYGDQGAVPSWTQAAKASTFTSADNIGLAIFQEHMLMAWRGSGKNGSSDSAIYNAKSYYYDYAHWMEHSLDILKDQPLRNICIPGAHDAAMYMAQHFTSKATRCNTVTQLQPMRGMLDAGIRYFDIRPVIGNDNKWYSGHFGDASIYGIQGCCGDTLKNILTQTLEFLQSGAKELVILKFSHYLDMGNIEKNTWGFTQSQMQNLINEVSGFGSYLFVNRTGKRLAEIPLGDMIGSGGKVLAVFDHLPDDVTKPDGIYTYADYDPKEPSLASDLVVYDVFAHDADLDDMRKDQIEKLNDPDNHGGDLFLFSWTLTLDKWQLLNGDPCITELAQQANHELIPSIQEMYQKGQITRTLIPNIIYVDLADGFATSVCVELNRKLLGGV